MAGFSRFGASLLAISSVCGLLVGCSSESNRYDISGKVTFKGQPVPVGKIYFSPDTSKGNDGPQGFADIKDGRYDTRSQSSKGSPTGAVTVRIEGFDGHPVGDFAFGRPLFVYETTLELSKATTEQNFDVPESAGKDMPRPGSKEI